MALNKLLNAHTNEHALIERRINSGNSLGAFNDDEAMSGFLHITINSENTRQRYNYALQRFMVWLKLQRRITLSEVTALDVKIYCEALWQTGPVWMKGVHQLRQQAENEDALLRLQAVGAMRQPRKLRPPRTNPLSETTIMSTVVVLKNFFSILHRSDYLPRNPLAVFAWTPLDDIEQQRRTIAKEKKKVVAIPPAIWRAILLHVNRSMHGSPRDSKAYFFYAKWRLSLICLYEAALRISEAAEHSTEHIKMVDGLHWLYIVGKSKRKRRIPCTIRMMRHIRWFRRRFEINTEHEMRFLFRSDRHGEMCINEAMHRAVAFKEFKKIVSTVLTKLEYRNTIDHTTETITIHSIRHTRLTSLAKVMNPEQLRAFAGHSRYETTLKYYQAEKTELHELANSRIK